MLVVRTYFWVNGIVVLLLILPCAARAQGSSAPADNQLWEFGVWGGEAVGKSNRQVFGGTQITMAGFHMGRVVHRSSASSGLRRTWEYTIELQPLFLQTRAQQVYGGGFAPVGVKWNFAPRGRYRPYVEWNGGAMFTQKNVPAGDTATFNFTLAFGPGVMIALPHNQALSVGLRYWHLSNAGTGNSNPSFNTLQFVIGYHWLKPRRMSPQQLSAAPSPPHASR